MSIYRYAVFLSLALALGSCVEPFEPEVGDYDSTLVVDGIFSNSGAPLTVTLSRSFPYAEEVGEPLTGAAVRIEDDQGGSYPLTEKTAGVYQSDSVALKGQIGLSYRLLIGTPDGNQFESDWEEMKPAPPIEELYFEPGEVVPNDPNLSPIPGAQIYLSTSDTENNSRYYRWEYVETYQFGLRHPPLIRVEFGENPGQGDDEVIFLFGSEEYEGSWCWKTESSTEIIIATTENFSQNVVQDLPLLFVGNNTYRLYIRYSLLARQYAISQDYYEFLRKIKESNQTTGSLFDPIPSEVFGNIRSSDGKDIPVLGYFAVAGISERRLFIDREDLPSGIGAPFGPTCMNDTIGLDFRLLNTRVKNETLIVYDYLYPPLIGPPIGFVLTQPPCTSCAVNRATNTVPDFW